MYLISTDRLGWFVSDRPIQHLQYAYVNFCYPLDTDKKRDLIALAKKTGVANVDAYRLKELMKSSVSANEIKDFNISDEITISYNGYYHWTWDAWASQSFYTDVQKEYTFCYHSKEELELYLKFKFFDIKAARPAWR